MRITIVTIFPSMFEGFLTEGIVARAIGKDLAKIDLINLRDFTDDNYRSVDDYPYGGGPGMVMKAEPILKAVGSVTGIDYLKLDGLNATPGEKPSFAPRTRTAAETTRIIILSPQGLRYDQNVAGELSRCESMILICGRYKAIDERVGTVLGAEELSIGDYVLSGGEVPAMAVVESIVRLIPGAMEDEDSAAGDSFENGLLDCAYYTRPEVVAGRKVPEILLSGNHEAIRKWRRKSCLLRTLERRLDLVDEAALSGEDRKLLHECKKGAEGEE